MEQEVATVGLDLAKNVLQVQAIAKDGAVRPTRAWRRRGGEPRGDLADHEAGAEIVPQQSGRRPRGNGWRVRPGARLGGIHRSRPRRALTRQAEAEAERERRAKVIQCRRRTPGCAKAARGGGSPQPASRSPATPLSLDAQCHCKRAQFHYCLLLPARFHRYAGASHE